MHKKARTGGTNEKPLQMLRLKLCCCWIS